MHHGSKNFEVTAPRSRFYQGGFGRLFADLDPWIPVLKAGETLESHFLKFATSDMVEFNGMTASQLASNDEAAVAANIAAGNPLASLPHAEMDSAVPSAYVYFGQFVDHDITLDVTPLSDAEVDPNRLHNFQTPRLDLDCLYGLGPDAQPYLYEHKDGGFSGRFRIGTFHDPNFPEVSAFINDPQRVGPVFADLQRNDEDKAIIGDPRNDENAIVAQIHLAFQLAHNRLVDTLRLDNETPENAFAKARSSLRRLYQWIVWNDFLARIVSPSIHAFALKFEVAGEVGSWKAGYEHTVYGWKNSPFMPVEFSVAAYRLGHSMVRNAYQTNGFSSGDNDRAPFEAGFGKFLTIFDRLDARDLRGERPLTLRTLVEWDWFVTLRTSAADIFPQHARKIDTKLANALVHLVAGPPLAPGENPKLMNVLAARNLMRGVSMKLPSGPDVAKALGISKAILAPGEPESLWFYVLKEAEVEGGGDRLGQVGSIIVAATFAGLLTGDPLSWVNQDPAWTPDRDPLLKNTAADVFDPDDPDNADHPRSWTLSSIIRLSGLAQSLAEFQALSAAIGTPPPAPVAPVK